MILSESECKPYSDRELVKLSLQQLDYFSCLYNRYEGKMIAYIKKISSLTQEEAEDVLQEAFIKIWRNLNDYDTDLKFSSWVYRIVHNETISYWRKKKSYGKDKQLATGEVSLKDDVVKEEEGQEEDKEAKVKTLLAAMPPKYREILVLRYFEGLSYDEISDVLKIPPGTVATRLNRAKKSFEKLAGKTFFAD